MVFREKCGYNNAGSGFSLPEIHEYYNKKETAMQTCYLAVDIGASSGRHIVGTVKDGRISLREVYRFENGASRKNGHLCWDADGLFRNVVAGMKACREAGFLPATMGIDTWGVDFVLLDGEGRQIGDAVAYRDSRTEHAREEMEPVLPFRELYARTGIQYEPFNTVYQLAALKKEHPEQLAAARTFLMTPDYLNYRLTGAAANEYTQATTTGLVGAESKTWDDEVISRLGFPRGIFQPLRMPGTVLGRLTPGVRQEVGFDCTVLLPASHDTGSAFLAVPTQDDHSAYLSSGTWSLLGVENEKPFADDASREAGFTNEGGYRYRYRYLKNIMGLWMIQSVRRELGEQTGVKPGFQELCDAAEASDYGGLVNADDSRFLAPASMIAAVKDACREAGYPEPSTPGELVRCIYRSLAEAYRKTVESLARLTGREFTSLNIVGGGSKDPALNQMTADALRLPVYAGPTEGTALGNLVVQFLAAGEYPDLAAARAAIRTSFPITRCDPR